MGQAVVDDIRHDMGIDLLNQLIEIGIIPPEKREAIAKDYAVRCKPITVFS